MILMNAEKSLVGCMEVLRSQRVQPKLPAEFVHKKQPGIRRQFPTIEIKTNFAIAFQLHLVYTTHERAPFACCFVVIQ